jgi:hypothetical protein
MVTYVVFPSSIVDLSMIDDAERGGGFAEK